MQTKHYRGHAAIKSADEGIAEIVVSVYGNVDHDGDIVVRGASAKQIAGEYGPNPKGLLDHDWSMRSAVAKTLRWWEDDDGLHVEAQYNLDKEAGRDAFSDLKFYGDDMEFSVGYSRVKASTPDVQQKAQGARRIIEEWQINEWSHVMLGANDQTRLVAAKALAEAVAHAVDVVAEEAATDAPPDESEPITVGTFPIEDEPATPAINPVVAAEFELTVATTILPPT